MKVQVLNSGVKLPEYKTEFSAGLDVEANISKPILLLPGQTVLVPTGLKVAIPEGYEIQVRPRSGLALKHNLTVLNTPGTVDSDYRGEIGVILINHGTSSIQIGPNTRIAQLVLSKVEKLEWEVVEKLSPTVRNEGGFGSTEGKDVKVKENSETVKKEVTEEQLKEVEEVPKKTTTKKTKKESPVVEEDVVKKQTKEQE